MTARTGSGIGRRRAAALATALLLALTAACGDDGGKDKADGDGSSAPQSSGPSLPSETPQPITDPEAQQLMATLSEGRDIKYHGRYELVTPGQPTLQLEVWRDGDKVRQDVGGSTTAGAVQTASFVVDGKAISCLKQGDADWTCANQGEQDPSTVGMFDAAAAELGGRDVVLKGTETIGGQQATCYEFPGDDGPATLCVTDEGIPARLATSTAQGAESAGEMSLVELSRDFDDSVFNPPVDPAG